MIKVCDIFSNFEDYDQFIAEENVSSIYSLINPSTIWKAWPGKETDVYFWATTSSGTHVGVTRNGTFVTV